MTARPFDTFTLSTWRFFQFNAFLLLISIITPIIVLIAKLINLPFEKLVNLGYFIKAKNKLAKSALKKIGITDSYGKTSTKFFLSTILEEEYRTLFTPASYNTPMGISKIINSNDLSKYEMFVAEMGADKKGDINTLCKLVKPDFGILTAIDIQHLKTFGSTQTIIEIKLSLFKNVSPDKFSIYNYDNKLLQENIMKYKPNIKLYSYSIETQNIKNVDIIAKDIMHTRKGLEFSAVFNDNSYLKINTELLGRHNASNLLACILASKLLGLSNEQILNSIKKIKPVEHRLQRIISPGEVLILDDAFNSNPSGAIEALKVLKEIEGNKKIIVTPGLIGLGEKENEINRMFGNNIACYADIAILIGMDKTSSIQQGILEKDFDKKNMFIVKSLNDSKEVLSKILVKGDVVLFENDLPDTYNE